MNQLPLFQTPSFSVTDLTRYLRELFDSDEVLQNVWVRGEVSNFSRPSSGHLYFTLKDSGAALRCVVWKSTAMRLRFGLQNGLAVEAHGAISLYERDGQYQLYVDGIRPAGEGLLFQEFMRLKNRLEAEGLFDPERKREIPKRPVRIGIVTSPTGAALQDMLNTLQRRYPLAQIYLSPCAVQGETAPAEIVSALERLWRSARPDVILLARGGGSLEDLWAFNDEAVVRAVAASPVPVITGVGHETDFTLADFAADLRAPTPTGAAVQATPDRADLISELYGMQSRLNNAMRLDLDHKAQDLHVLHQRLNRASPLRHIQDERQALDQWQTRSLRAMQHAFQLQRAHLNGLSSRLGALNPNAILQRGFAIVQRPDGSLVHSVQGVVPGEMLDIHLRDGRIQTKVQQTQIDPDSSTNQGV
jgi:exodeoxyribonuclease VII large subunit